MGSIVYHGIVQWIGKLALFFIVIPAAVIAVAYLIGILILTCKELLKK